MLAMERALEELEEARAENERLRAHVHAMGGDPLGADAVVNLFSDDSCSEGLAQPEDAGEGPRPACEPCGPKSRLAAPAWQPSEKEGPGSGGPWEYLRAESEEAVLPVAFSTKRMARCWPGSWPPSM